MAVLVTFCIVLPASLAVLPIVLPAFWAVLPIVLPAFWAVLPIVLPIELPVFLAESTIPFGLILMSRFCFCTCPDWISSEVGAK